MRFYCIILKKQENKTFLTCTDIRPHTASITDSVCNCSVHHCGCNKITCREKGQQQHYYVIGKACTYMYMGKTLYRN